MFIASGSCWFCKGICPFSGRDSSKPRARWLTVYCLVCGWFRCIASCRLTVYCLVCGWFRCIASCRSFFGLAQNHHGPFLVLVQPRRMESVRRVQGVGGHLRALGVPWGPPPGTESFEDPSTLAQIGSGFLRSGFSLPKACWCSGNELE